jgi:hypothetical protein
VTEIGAGKSKRSRQEDSMRFRTLAAMVMATGTALVSAGVAAGGATTSIIIDRYEVEVSATNMCSGEEILLTGKSHGLLRMTETRRVRGT